jgi:hypothetical protein
MLAVPEELVTEREFDCARAEVKKKIRNVIEINRYLIR